MELDTLTTFFLWCSLINGGILAFPALLFMLAPGAVYRTLRRWFPRPRETFDLFFHAFIGTCKIVFLVSNLVPLVALSVMR